MPSLPSARLSLLALLLLLGVGIVAWVFVPVFQGRQAARRDLGTHRLELGLLGAVLVANAVLTIPLAPFVSGGNQLTLTTFSLAALATQIPMLAVVYLRFVLPGALTWQDLGLRPMSPLRVLGVGVVTGLAGLAMTAAIGAALDSVGLRQNQLDQYRFLRGANLGEFLIVFTLGSVCAPFVEELFFRGVLFGVYQRRQPLWLAYLVSGLLFALLHVSPTSMDVTQIAALLIGIFALGTLLAWTYQRTGSLYPGMVAHGVNNAIGLSLFYFAGVS